MKSTPNLFFRKIFNLFYIFIFFFSSFSAAAQPQIKPIILNPVKNEFLWNKNWMDIACKNFASPCSEKSSTLFSPSDQPTDANIFYVWHKTNLILQRMQLTTSKEWEILNEWNINDFNPDEIEKNKQAEIRTDFFPAIYPIAKNEWAIAITFAVQEAYSGGGAEFTTANFYQLFFDNQTPNFRLAFPSIPFSCYSMIRACFTKKEYKTSSHCHDENNGSLRLKILDKKNTNYAWEFTWLENSWAAHAQPSAKKISRLDFKVDLFSEPSATDLEKINFCNGPQ